MMFHISFLRINVAIDKVQNFTIRLNMLIHSVVQTCYYEILKFSNSVIMKISNETSMLWPS